jgi:putative ABC transport system permease protein
MSARLRVEGWRPAGRSGAAVPAMNAAGPAPLAVPSPAGTLRRLWPLATREWRHHPWRHAVALLAVALGVALAFSVHLINRSALAEFSAAVRSANGEPDLTLRAQREGFDDALFDRVARDPAVEHASPVVEVDTYAPARAAASGLSGAAPRAPVRVLGIDALRIAPLAVDLLPRADAGENRLAMLDPGAVFLNPAAAERLALDRGADGVARLRLQRGAGWVSLRVAGHVPAGGPPLVVTDIAGAQAAFGFDARVSRIDLRLVPGSDIAALRARLGLPAGVEAVAPVEAEQRVSSLSRAYRVNLTVLAGVALFVGAFLVFSVVSLSVAQRTPSFALLGVLGLTARERRALVLAECAVLGAAGSAAGLALGAALALAALRWLAGDLGGGYFPGIAPVLQIDAPAVAVFGALGVAAALAGGWWPARQAERLAPAQALKGLGTVDDRPPPAVPGLALLAAGCALAFAPPIGGLPLAAYLSVAALLAGGVALVPSAVHLLLARVPRPASPLARLAIERARFQRRTATAAVAGVVASLALSVAITVMVASFRDGVSAWLDSVLPADLYARTASSSVASDQAWFDDATVARAAALPGVERVQASRVRALQLDPGRPSVTLIARPLADPAAALPLIGAARAPQPGEVGVWVSEAMVALYDARPGTTIALPIGGRRVDARVLGVWRDYARQFGAVAIDDATYRALSGDERLNDLALWLAPGAEMAEVQAALRALMPDPSLLEFAATTELRELSLRIFDRSFAVTYYLQAVAIGIGLVGIAASLSAQVLARRKEFGLLAHLGLTRREVVALVAGEAAAWLAAGVLVGVALGIAVSLVLVFVVNPQSFHWTMDLVLPWPRLAALALAVFVAGVATAAWSARRAAGRQAVLAVKEDW